MFKRLALTTTITGSVLGTGLHFLSHGYVALENKAVNYINSHYDNTIAGLAKDKGFVKPIILDEVTRETIVEREARINDVPISLAHAVIKAESNGKAYATSKAGAIGLMQVMPEHVPHCGYQHFSELYDEEKNIKCGMRILKEAISNQKGNIIRALKEYNAGAKRIDKTEENRNYPHVVLSKLE